MKTKEWLRSHLEEGDILEAAVLLELLDSYIHKSEFGNVSPGDERVVSGDAVNSAITAACARVVQTVRGMVADILAEMLPSILANYVTSSGLAAALADMATKTWVNDQISGLATNANVEESLSQQNDSVMTELGTRLQQYVLATALTEALAQKVSATSFAEALALKADATNVYTKTQIDAAIAARPTQTEMAGEVGAAVTDLPNNTTIQQLRDKINALVTRTNTLSHVACGSETMNYCMSDITQLQAPTP